MVQPFSSPSHVRNPAVSSTSHDNRSHDKRRIPIHRFGVLLDGPHAQWHAALDYLPHNRTRTTLAYVAAYGFVDQELGRVKTRVSSKLAGKASRRLIGACRETVIGNAWQLGALVRLWHRNSRYFKPDRARLLLSAASAVMGRIAPEDHTPISLP